MKIKSIKIIELEEEKLYYDVINANPYNNFLVKTNSGYIVSHNCFFDEISFVPTLDVNKQKEKAKTLVNTALARMQSRFMKGDLNPTILCLASSKRTEASYMETFILQKKSQDSKTTKIVDEPQWKVRTDKVTDRWFKVAIGNKFLDSEVVPLDATEEDFENYVNRGYSLLDVPIGYYENFLDDIDIALTDIAGISVTSSTRFISGVRLLSVKTKSYLNLFTKEIITVGNSPTDTTQYYDFIDLSRVDPEMKSKPLYIHLDMSISGDKTGIAGVWIKGKKPPVDGLPESKELYYQLAFSVSVKAPKGYQISFEKNRLFIYWLRELGFRVKTITSDTFQSADLGQALLNKGFDWEILSVDRVSSDRICLPYQYFKSTIYEERIQMFECGLLTEEILGLERDNNSGKVDHSPNGINSKDMCDAVCGAVYSASKHAEEYAFDYGEDLEITKLITDDDYLDNKNIITINFEEQLKRSHFLDFGMGAAQDIPSGFYAAEGIIMF